MRFTVLAGLLLVACADGTPTGAGGNEASLTGTGTNTAVPLAARSGGAPPIVFNTQLTSDQEPFDASTSEAKGHAQVAVLTDGTIEFIVVINNKSGEIYNRIHIHNAPAGANGPIHWDFLEAGVPVASIAGQPATLRGIAVPRADASVEDLLANPDQYYVNVHSNVFAGGAIRGQLP